MTISNYQKVFNFLSFLLAVIALIQLISLVFLVLVFFSEPEGFNIASPANGFVFFSTGFITNEMPKHVVAYATLGVTIPRTIIYAFVTWQGSRLFGQLGNGVSPFNDTFAKAAESIAKLLIALDILTPVVYSLLSTLLLPQGNYHLQLSLTPMLITGLVVYAFAGILRYGASLQQLADETV